MTTPRLLCFGPNPWANGLRLALLNAVLAALSAASFVGVLFVVSALNTQRIAHSGPARELPFPYPLLLLLYAAAFLVAWWWCGKRLPDQGRARLVSATVGAAPLLGFGLLGWAGAAAVLIWHQVKPHTMGVASFVVCATLATLVLLAGLSCVGFLCWTSGRRRDQP